MWIDRTDHDDLDDTLQSLPPARLREREQMVKRIVFAIADRLDREAAALPGRALLVPPSISVYLDPDENLRWINQARRWLIEGINESTAQRVRDMPGFDSGRTQIPRVELREDTTLALGAIRVEPAWGAAEEALNSANTDLTETYVYPSDDEPTIVEDSQHPLYQLEVWRSGLRCSRKPINQAQVLIGRGTCAKPVDVTLADPRVSRVHARLDRERNDYWITSFGKNRLRVHGRPLQIRHRTRIKPGEPIEICDFTLRIAA